ncbi:MAG TPA: Mpo1-like protein [Vicinamibacteria bacterium]|nr:Mpo1-like protein [Vicinamibacteria bacterium]
MSSSPTPFAAFYEAYLEQHRHPLNRLLHLLAKVLALLALAAAVLRGSWLALAAAPLLAVLPCWLGHLIFERNRPTSWTRPGASLLGSLRIRLFPRPAAEGSKPYYSLASDLCMCAAMLGLRGSRGSAATSERT